MSAIEYSAQIILPLGERLMASRYQQINNDFPRGLSIDQAVDYIEMECMQLDGLMFNLGSAYERIHQPKNRKKVGDHSAVSLEITAGRDRIVLLSQQWALVEQNIYAMYLTIRNIVAFNKWGVLEGSQIFSALSAQEAVEKKKMKNSLPQDDVGVRAAWMDTLDLHAGDSIETANHNYRQKAKEAALDEDRLLELNQAIDKARNYFS